VSRWASFGLLGLVVVASAVAAPFPRAILSAAQTISADSLRRPIEVLAGDDFEGRAPGSLGEEKTVSYLVNQFPLVGSRTRQPGRHLHSTSPAGRDCRP